MHTFFAMRGRHCAVSTNNNILLTNGDVYYKVLFRDICICIKACCRHFIGLDKDFALGLTAELLHVVPHFIIILIIIYNY